MTKVLTLSEFVKLDALPKAAYLNALCKSPLGFPVRELINTPYHQIDGYDYCLSQHFKPELITELFDGWKLKESSSFSALIYGEHKVFVHQDLIRFDMRELPLFRTLGDFVNDCERCGIELHLKEKK